MEASLKLGNGDWGVKNDSLLAYDDFGGKFRPLPFDFTRASSATVVNKQGLIETVQSGISRIDFKNDAKGALLLEPQRSNLITYSEAFDNAYWTKSGASVVSGFTSPDGTTNAFKLVEGTNTGTHELSRTVSFTSGQYYSYSVFVKKGERTQFLLSGGNTSTFVAESLFDVENGTIISTYLGTSSIELISNGFYRCTISGVAGATAATAPRVYLSEGAGNISYTGDGTSGVYIFGAQLEQSSYPTSYIPTQGAISTRLSESCSQTPPSGIIGQTEGTVFLDSKMALQSINNYQLFSINNASGVDRIRVLTATAGRLRFIYQLNSGVSYSFYNPTDYSDLTSLKIAFTYKSGDIKVYINGVLVDSSTNTFTIAQTLTNIDIATSAGGYNQMLFNDVQLYNTALTDAELQDLTTI